MSDAKEVRLGDVADLNWGDTSKTKASYVPDGHLAYSASGPDGFLPYYDFEGPGVVISAIGANCGQTWLAKGKWSCIKNTLRFWSITKEADTEYLYWLTRSPDFWPKRGSAQPFISQGDARALRVALPPAKTQRAVAKLLGSLNEKIALNQRMNETLEAMARAIFKDWFVDFGPTRAKMEGRPPYLAPDTWAHFPARLDGDGKPDGWKPGLVADLAKVAGGKQLHASLIAPTGTVPVFGGAGPMGFTQSHNVQGWVITFGRVGAYCGQFFWTKGKAWINNNASLVTPKDERDAEWLFLCMSSFDLHPVKKGAAQPFISNGDMAAFPVTIPPAGVRHAFRTVIGPLFDRQQLGLLETSILVDIRDLLLPKLMSGEILMKDAEKAVEALV